MKPRLLRLFRMVIVLICPVVFAHDVFAQPKEGASKFYEKNYAKTPLKGEKRSSGNDGESETKTKPEKKDAGRAEEPLIAVASDDEENSAPELPVSIVPEDKPGVPVLSIGAVINSLDFTHFYRNLNSLSLLAQKHDFEIGRVYAIGDFQKMLASAKMLGRLMARRGQLDWLPTVPEKFKITKSPTWIVSTADGDFVIEGMPLLESFFNAKGEFVESVLEDMRIEADPVAEKAEPEKAVVEEKKES